MAYGEGLSAGVTSPRLVFVALLRGLWPRLSVTARLLNEVLMLGASLWVILALEYPLHGSLAELQHRTVASLCAFVTLTFCCVLLHLAENCMSRTWQRFWSENILNHANYETNQV